MIRRFLRNYLQRHRHPLNRVLHAVGVPLAFLVAPMLWLMERAWYIHAGCFLAGYFLQFAGHAVEGNDAGEIVCVKRFLGMPYTEFASTANASSQSERNDDTTSA